MTVLKHSLWFAPLLALTLAIKFNGTAVPQENPATTLKTAAATLQHQGFQVRIELIGNGRLTIKRSDCSAQLRLLDTHAIADDFYRSTLQPRAKILYAWRGQWYDERPSIGPLLEFYAKRELVRRGVVIERMPLWVAGMAKSCDTMLAATFSVVPLLMQPVPSSRL